MAGNAAADLAFSYESVWIIAIALVFVDCRWGDSVRNAGFLDNSPSLVPAHASGVFGGCSMASVSKACSGMSTWARASVMNVVFLRRIIEETYEFRWIARNDRYPHTTAERKYKMVCLTRGQVLISSVCWLCFAGLSAILAK